MKTKPTQHSVNELRRIGIQPHALRLPLRAGARPRDPPQDRALRQPPRGGRDLGPRRRQHLQGAARLPRRGHGRPDPRPLRDRGRPARTWPSGRSWSGAPTPRASARCKIALVGKYVQLEDAYKSVIEALTHGGWHHGVDVEVELVALRGPRRGRARGRRRDPDPRRLRRARDRGQGRGGADRAREAGSRSSASASGCRSRSSSSPATSAGMDGANSAEFDPETPVPGRRPAARAEGGLRHRRDDAARRRPGEAPRGHPGARDLRRGRHLQAPPPPLRGQQPCCAAGSRTRAWSPAAPRPTSAWSRSIELPDHPFFVASQFHPEFNSRPTRPEPLFREFVGAAAKRRRARGRSAGEDDRRGRVGRSSRTSASSSHCLTRLRRRLRAFVDLDEYRQQLTRVPGTGCSTQLGRASASSSGRGHRAGARASSIERLDPGARADDPRGRGGDRRHWVSLVAERLGEEGALISDRLRAGHGRGGTRAQAAEARGRPMSSTASSTPSTWISTTPALTASSAASATC